MNFKDYAVILLAEFLGTAFLMYFGCMGAYSNPYWGPMAFGLAILACIQMFGHISGAHVNPAVTIAALIMQQIKSILVPLYLVGQFIGAIAGYVILMATLPDSAENVCVTVPHPEINDGKAFGIEFIITSILIFALCAAWDKKNEHKLDSTALRIGLLLSGIFIVAAPLTGASLNSPRSFAPAIFNTKLGFTKSHWVYWAGPNLGAVVSALVYKFVFKNCNELPKA